MSNLVIATEDDLEIVVSLIEKFQQESGYKNILFDRDVTAHNLRMIFQSPDGLVLLLKDNDKTIGMLIALAAQMLFSKARMSSELAWWIDPEYRKSRDGLKLLEAYEYWSKHKANCDYVQMVCLEALDPEKLTKLYERKGYKRFEQAFVKEN